MLNSIKALLTSILIRFGLSDPTYHTTDRTANLNHYAHEVALMRLHFQYVDPLHDPNSYILHLLQTRPMHFNYKHMTNREGFISLQHWSLLILLYKLRLGPTIK